MMSTTAIDPVSSRIEEREVTVVVPAVEVPSEMRLPAVAKFLKGLGFGLVAGLMLLPLGALSSWIGGVVGQAMFRNAMNP
jgi:hypothetical protein